MAPFRETKLQSWIHQSSNFSLNHLCSDTCTQRSWSAITEEVNLRKNDKSKRPINRKQNKPCCNLCFLAGKGTIRAMLANNETIVRLLPRSKLDICCPCCCLISAFRRPNRFHIWNMFFHPSLHVILVTVKICVLLLLVVLEVLLSLVYMVALVTVEPVFGYIISVRLHVFLECLFIVVNSTTYTATKLSRFLQWCCFTLL